MGVVAVHKSRDVLRVVSEFFRDVEGATAVEYGIIATAMFLAIIPAFLYVSTGIMIKFQSLTDFFNSLG
jgi:Flp pilus assembly pilin Flp